MRLVDVGKDYAKVDSRGGRMRLVVSLLLGRRAHRVFRALDGVSFDLAAGESIGVIGENGAGKSTLLKAVAGVIEPSRGSIETNGRVSALLELGSGFHPEYSGLANIALAAALLGLEPSEIAAKREEIIAFADIGEHIHDPIKHYSSGMVVRLGFAVATALTPDVLITDEVLAVGDESFQKKCIVWIERFLGNGGSLLLCSHSMYHIRKLCRTALWLREGRVEQYGDAAEVTQAYLAYHEEKSAHAKESAAAVRASTSHARAFLKWEILPDGMLEVGQGICVSGEVSVADAASPALSIELVRADGTPVYGTSTVTDGTSMRRLDDGRYGFRLRFASLSLLPGKYVLRGHVLAPDGGGVSDTRESPFVVRGATRELGLVRLPHRWKSATAGWG